MATNKLRAPLRVFLGSTNLDLSHYRKEIARCIDDSKHLACVNQEKFGPRPNGVLETCIGEVGDADIYVGIIGMFRGAEDPCDQKLRSVTEIEYDAALASKKPCFICLTPTSFQMSAHLRDPDEVHKRQLEFRERASKDGWNNFVVTKEFSSPERLASLIINSILGYLIERRHPSIEDSSELRRIAYRSLGADFDVDLNLILDDPSKIDLFSLEGQLLARVEQLREAEQQARRLAAEHLRYMGALVSPRDTSRAIKHYDSATTLDGTNAEGWRQLGIMHLRRSDYEKANSCLDHALRLAVDAGDVRLEGRIQSNLGAVQYRLRNYDSAREKFEFYLRVSEERQDRKGAMRATGNIGLVFQKLQNFAVARQHHAVAFEIATELDDKHEMARQLGNLAVDEHGLGHQEKAVQIHEQALEIDAALDNQEGIARHKGNLGELFIELREPQRAIAYLVQAYEIAIRLSNKSECARHSFQLGVAHAELARKNICTIGLNATSPLECSVYWFKNAERLFVELLESDRVLDCAKRLAEIYATLGVVIDQPHARA